MLPRIDEPLPFEPFWPDEAVGRTVLVLVDAVTTLERRLVEAWVDRHRPRNTEVELIRLAPSRRRRRGARTDPRLGPRLSRGDDPFVLPIRVAWFPPERGGRRMATWRDLLSLGDPRDPDPVRQYVIAARHPERVRIVLGEGATASTLTEAHRRSVETRTLTDWVTRRAWRALDRAERLERGNRYKVPKFVPDEILARGDFRDEVIRLGAARGLPPALALSRARHYLREIAATHSPFVIDLLANAIHWLYSQGYGGIRYDPAQVADIASLGSDHPVAFLPSHRSNMDRLALQYLLWENDLPPNHTAAGVNMNFFPVGPLIRRTGAFFIRRSFRDNDLYKYVLRTYLDYLIEKRFPLEWYMEGGRSRSGKLMPPRYGLLSWVVDSVRRGHADDLYLIPTSIAYDHIQDVADYAREARGGEKQRESFGWALSAIRSLRRRYGDIHVRFGDPISVTKELAGTVGDAEEITIEVQKLAFEVMYRISRITPITPSSIVAIALLARHGRGRTLPQIARTAAAIDAYVERFGLPRTEPLRFEDTDEVARVLDLFEEHEAVSVHRGGAEPVYHLTPDQALRAAYYRNTIVHFFVPGAIAELTLAAVADGSVGPDEVDDHALELRDLLKFEFFFGAKERFLEELHIELAEADPQWRDRIRTPGGADELLGTLALLRAHWALLPFLEAYLVVADTLAASTGPFDDKEFLRACLGRGEQYRLEGRVRAPEAVSKALYASALSLARNRGLVDGSAQARGAFSEEVRAVLARAVRIGRLAEVREAERVTPGS